MEIRKGFYFSFDAILALTVMSATMVMMLGMMDTNQNSLTSESGQADNLRTESRDIMSLASAETFETYNETFKQELIANSVMEPKDMQKNVLNGITYLWAAGNFSYAEEATRKYFSDQVNGPYQIQINEDGNTYTLPQDVQRPDSTNFVTTSSSLVSGHRLNSSNSGYRSRARVTSAKAQRTEITPISPSGNLPSSPGFSSGSFETTQYIPVKQEKEKVIQQAILDLNFREADFGPSDFTVTVNGQEVTGTQLASQGSGGDGGSQYYRYDVTDEIQMGINNTITYSTSSVFFTGGFLNPGSRLRVDYTAATDLIQQEKVTKQFPLKYVRSQYGGGGGNRDQASGVFNVENFEIPRTADIHNATLHMNAEGVGTETTPTGWDVRTLLNGNTVIQEEATGVYSRQVNITEAIQPGNNLLRLYINHDGGDRFWGGTETVLNANPGSEDHSYIEVTYTDNARVGYGKYEAAVAEEIGETSDGSLTYSRKFTQYESFSKINLYMAIFNPDQPVVEARTGTQPYQTVYSSGEIAPSLVTINPELFNFDQTNYVKMSDSADTRFLEYSLFEYSAFVAPRVGYGPVFDNRTAAQEDAVQRLRNKSGDFFNFEEINPSSVTIGGEKRLWGPSTVTLVRWKE